MTSKTATLKAAIKTRDDAVPMPEQRVVKGSFASQVSALNPGESVSRIHSPNENLTLKELRAELSEMKAMVRNNTTPAVTAARRTTGGSYTIETSETITPGGSIFIVCIVTRIE